MGEKTPPQPQPWFQGNPRMEWSRREGRAVEDERGGRDEAQVGSLHPEGRSVSLSL